MKLTEAVAKHTTSGNYLTKNEVKDFVKDQLPKMDQENISKSAQIIRLVNTLRWGVITKGEFKDRIKELR